MTFESAGGNFFWGVLVWLKFYWAPDIVLGRFSHFYIAIAYSNSISCGEWTPSFCEFTCKLSKFQQTEHTSVPPLVGLGVMTTGSLV